jgi:hypothetical protein
LDKACGFDFYQPGPESFDPEGIKQFNAQRGLFLKI